VTDGAALEADALDYDGLADCVLRLIEDEELAGRLRERGLRRARCFTWEKAAQRLVELYRQIVEEAGPTK
jgi:glycosyltransferase involved in cell wall biosynthesis